MVLKGIPAAPGIAIGKARIRLSQTGVSPGVRAASPAAELARLEEAIERARDGVARNRRSACVRERASRGGHFPSQRLMLDDPLLAGAIAAAIRENLRGGGRGGPGDAAIWPNDSRPERPAVPGEGRGRAAMWAGG